MKQSEIAADWPPAELVRLLLEAGFALQDIPCLFDELRAWWRR